LGTQENITCSSRTIPRTEKSIGTLVSQLHEHFSKALGPRLGNLHCQKHKAQELRKNAQSA